MANEKAGKNLTKYDTSVARARGEGDSQHEGVTALTLDDVSRSVAGGAKQMDPQRLMALIASGDVEAAEQLIALEEGQMLEGQLTGCGTAILEDEKTGEPREVTTWKMTLTSGARVSFLGSAQLNRMLPEFLGRAGNTIIARGGESRIKGGKRVMTQYFVAGPKASAARFIGVRSMGAGDAESLMEIRPDDVATIQVR